MENKEKYQFPINSSSYRVLNFANSYLGKCLQSISNHAMIRKNLKVHCLMVEESRENWQVGIWN